MKTKKQLKLYMRKYLSDPVNRACHNEYSKQYAARKYGASKAFRKATAKRAAAWSKAYFKKNPLVKSLYQAFKKQVRDDEHPHFESMYSCLLYLVRRDGL